MALPALAVGLWIAAWAAVWVGAGRPWVEIGPIRSWPRLELAIVVLLTLGALAARVVDLQGIPWLFTGDEGAASLKALEFVSGARNNLFNVAWFSFPSLSTFLQSLPMAVLGRGVAPARVSSAVAGAMTVAAVWWFARPLFGRSVALASAALMAAFPLHIHFSRTALNNVWDSLSAALLVGALFRAWTTNRRGVFLLAGFALGISQFFYTSARAWLVIVPIWMLLAWFRQRAMARTRLPGVLLMCLAAAVVCLPIAGFYLRHPSEFLAPMNRVSLFGEWGELLVRVSGRTPVETAWYQIRGAVTGFGVTPMFGHFSPAPMLLPLAAVLFWLGVGALFLPGGRARHVWLLIWPAAAVLASIVSDNPPTSQRYVFVAPLVCALIALPGCRAAAWLSLRRPGWRAPIRVCLGLLIALVMAMNLSYYFGTYTAGHLFGDYNTEAASQIARFLQQQGGPRQVCFFGSPRMSYFSHASIEFLAPEATGIDVSEPLTSPPDWSLSQATTFVFLPERSGERELVARAFPGGVNYTGRSRSGSPLFYVYVFDRR